MLTLVQRVVRLAAEALQLVGVREYLPGRGELLVFSGPRRNAIDFPELEGEELGARRVFSRGGEHAIAFGSRRNPRRERLGNRFPERLQTRELVEQIEMRGGIQQDLMLVLAVKVDERAGQLTKCCACREGAVDKRPAAALR